MSPRPAKPAANMKPGHKEKFATIAEMQRQLYEMSGDTVNAVFAARIKDRRTSLKMTQDILARACCVTRVSVSNLEGGTTHCTLPRLVLLCSALQCSADYLLGLSDDPTPR